jgi:hypothetical protein
MIFIDIFHQWFGGGANQKLQSRDFSLLLGVEVIMPKWFDTFGEKIPSFYVKYSRKPSLHEGRFFDDAAQPANCNGLINPDTSRGRL